MNCQYDFKMILIGYSCVGKSSMLQRYREGLFPNIFNVTIGVNLFYHILEVEPGVRVKLHILDTTGVESFWPLIRTYFPETAGCLLVFDLGNRASFNYIKNRYSEVYTSANPNTLLFVLVGHKCDIERREVSDEEVEQFSSDIGAPYIEASAKTGHNVSEVFELMARRIYQGFLSGEEKTANQGSTNFYNRKHSTNNRVYPFQT